MFRTLFFRIFRTCLLNGVLLPATALTAQDFPLAPVVVSSPPHCDELNAPLGAAEREIEKEHFEAAITSVTSLTKICPDSWRAHYDLGYALFRVRGGGRSLTDNLRQSIQELARSLQLHEQNADAHKILGLDLTMIQREDLAGIEFERTVRLAPASAEGHYFLGRHFMHLQQYAAAAPELTKATELDPNYMKAFENLGITLERLGSFDQALTNLNRALELDKGAVVQSDEPYIALAHFYDTHGNTSAALSLARNAVQLNPRSEEALMQLAVLYRAQGKWQQALDALLQAEKLHPTAATTQFLLGRTYKALGDIPRSQQAFSEYDRLRKRADQPSHTQSE